MIISYIYLFILVRGIFGVLIGIVSPLSVSLIIENFPSKIRGKSFIFCRIGKMIGEFFAAVIGYLCLDKSLTSGNWRALLLWSSVPAFISYYLGNKYLMESPRYLFSKNYFELAFDKMKLIYNINHPDKLFQLSGSDKDSIYNFYNRDGDLIGESPSFLIDLFDRLKRLFDDKLKRVTLLIWGMWFAMTFVFYGQTFILPILLSKFPTKIQSDSILDQPFAKIIIPILAEIPAAFLCAYLIDQPRFGRQKLIFTAFSLSAIAYLFCYFSSQFFFILYLSIARFLLVIGYSVKYTYTSEIYHTNLRSTGVGAASAFGRIGGITMPLILIWAVEIEIHLPFICFFIICIFGAICTHLFPYDTFNKELDT